MSNVEIAKIEICASAKGAARELRIPVKAKSSGLSTLRHPQLLSTSARPDGTCASEHTMESSSGVRVMESKLGAAASSAHCGMRSCAGSLHTAKVSARRRKFRLMGTTESFDHR